MSWWVFMLVIIGELWAAKTALMLVMMWRLATTESRAKYRWWQILLLAIFGWVS